MMKISLVSLFIGGEIINLVSESGPVAKAVLLILLLFSIFSWSIILSKWTSLRRARAQSGRFLRAFRKAQKLQDVMAVSEQFKPSPLVPVFENGYEEFRKAGKLTAVQRATQIASSEELTRLERRLPWLATTGAVTPFIGLFGTVWGIMNAFRGLSVTHSSSIQAVAPGIAEALIATAVGLAAAIPALMAYNYFVQQIKVLAAEMDNFSHEFLNIAERHFFK